MAKRMCLMLVMAAAVFTLFIGCNKEPGIAANSVDSASVVNKTGFPIVKEPVSLRFMGIRGSQFQNGYDSMAVFQQYEKDTGIDIIWEEVTEEAWVEKTKLILASGVNLPDAFYGGSIDAATVFKYGQQELIRPLNDLIENYTENAQRWIEARPDIKKMMTYTDGKIYSIPTIDESLSTRIPGMLIVNQTWLDRVGLERPKTVDEFYTMLKTFKENDANGNGVKGDEIPLSLRQYNAPNSIDANTSLTNLFGFFGVVDDNSHVMIKDDRVVYVPATDEYRRALEFFHKLYVEGLLDEETFTQNSNQFWSKSRSPEGIGFTTAFSWLELNNGNVEQNNYQIMDPLDGQVVCKPVYVAGLGVNRFVITTTNKYPEATMRWIDTFLDNGERALESRFGKEGETWAWIDNEKSKFTELAQTPAGNRVDAAYISQFGPVWFSVQWELEDLWRKKQNTIQQFIDRARACNEVYINYAVQTWPGLGFDEETNTAIVNIDTDLRKYTDNMLSRFIIEGVTDSAWNSYVERCRQLRVAELVQIYQKRWDSFLGS